MSLRVTCAHQSLTIVPKKVVFSILKTQPRNSSQFFYFSVESDQTYEYRGFYEDFGPPSLLQLFNFTRMVKTMIGEHSEILHFYCSPAQDAKSNSCLYITFFRMIHLGIPAESAFSPISTIAGSLKPFRDASTLPISYDLSVLDCLRGIEKAMSHGWLNYDHFDPVMWSKMEALENGNMNWLVPGQLLAFASPYSTSTIGDLQVATPKAVIPIFKELGITRVVRLNKQFYEANEFKEAGIEHTELYFPDGSVPEKGIVQEFLKLCTATDILAVHCKAGLGRTYFWFYIY